MLARAVGLGDCHAAGGAEQPLDPVLSQGARLILV